MNFQNLVLMNMADAMAANVVIKLVEKVMLLEDIIIRGMDAYTIMAASINTSEKRRTI